MFSQKGKSVWLLQWVEVRALAGDEGIDPLKILKPIG
jgi:hypothetical protein